MSEPLDRERYLRKTSDRLHDRFLERPVFLDLEVIRVEIKKLDAQIGQRLASGQTWPTVMNRLGDPSEYADAIYAQTLLSPQLALKAGRTEILIIVLKVFFVVAPVNFIFAIGPLLIGLLLLVFGWVGAALFVVGPVVVIIQLALVKAVATGAAEVLFLIALFAFGQLAALFMISASRLIFRAVWAWLDWNIRFLRAEPRR